MLHLEAVLKTRTETALSLYVVPCAVKRKVLATNGGVLGRNGGSTGGNEAMSALVCDTCAARTFPETSVRPSGEVRFRCAERAIVLRIGFGSVGSARVSLAHIVYHSLPFS